MNGILNTIKDVVTKKNAEILLGVGIAGMVVTTVMAVKATPKAISLIEQRKTDICADELGRMEIIKTTWKCYIPSVVIGGVSIACLIFSGSVNGRRNAALATAYSLSESALKEYQGKVIETLGEKKEKEIHSSIAKERLEKKPVSSSEVYITEKGNTLCYDSISGRYFKSDIDTIKAARNEINYLLNKDMYVSLNDFYYEIGLMNTKQGNDLGWNITDGMMDLDFYAQLADDDTPCIVLNYSVAPRYDYQNR